MTPEQFCYWLQGYFELGAPGRAGLTDAQMMTIRDHLALVFTKVTPDRSRSQLLQEEIDRARRTQPGVTCTDTTRIC